MTDGTKKPNKIAIPDEGAPQWAKDRWYEICMLDGFGHVGPHLIAMIEEEPIDEDLIEAREMVDTINGAVLLVRGDAEAA